MDKRIRLCFLGVDGVGKTTLAQHVAHMMGWTYYKDSLYKSMFFGNVDYTEHSSIALLQYMDASKECAVFDRFFWDEAVYGHVFSRRKIIPENFRFLDSYAQTMGFRIVYMQKSSFDSDDKIKAKQVPILRERYAQILYRTTCPVLRIDADDENLEKQFKQIRSWLV